MGGSGWKTTTLVRDHEYFMHTKFHQNPSSGSGEEVENVKVYGRRWTSMDVDGQTDGWMDGRSDDRRCAMTIAHLSLRLRWAKKGQTRPNSNLTCIMWRQIHIWNFNSICRKMTKKSPENEILAKGNNSCKNRSKATKVTLDLYYVKTNSYMKFQLNMSKDDKEKSGKRNFSKGQ